MHLSCCPCSWNARCVTDTEFRLCQQSWACYDVLGPATEQPRTLERACSNYGTPREARDCYERLGLASEKLEFAMSALSLLQSSQP